MIRPVAQEEWPIVDGEPWDEHRYVRKDKWDRMTYKERSDVLLYLDSRGRMVRPITIRGERVVLIHTPKPAPTSMSVLRSAGISLAPSSDFVRHSAIVSVRIEVEDYEEALAIFREWLEDMAAIGVSPE